MSNYRRDLPQLSGELYLTDAGLETDLIFNHGIEIREFAAHTLLPDEKGREAVADYLRGYLSLAMALSPELPQLQRSHANIPGLSCNIRARAMSK